MWYVVKRDNHSDLTHLIIISIAQQNKRNTSIHFNLHVYVPTVVEGPTSYQKNEGSQLTMECYANADKEAQIEFTWKFGNFDLSQGLGFCFANQNSQLIQILMH